MDFLASFVLITSALARQVVAITTQQIQTDLYSNLSNGSQIVLTTDSSYPTDFTQRWSIYEKAEPAYAVAAKPATTKDVQTILRYVTQNKIPFLATGGGHGYSTTLSGLHNALDVDLSNFKRIKVDASTNTMVVGAGSKFHDMFDPLYAAGKMMRKFPTYSTSLCTDKASSFWWDFSSKHHRPHVGWWCGTFDWRTRTLNRLSTLCGDGHRIGRDSNGVGY